MGEGVSARFDPSEYGSAEYLEASRARHQGAQNALQFLGIEDFWFMENRCCRFDSVDLLDLVKVIEQKISIFRPTHIFCHNPIEVNIDHRTTYRAVEAAVRPSADQTLEAVYSFEIPCSGNWTFQDTFKPNCYIDIESVWDKKLTAWSFYVGEERPFPFPRSVKGLETMARFRGMQSGLKYAEGLRLLRRVI